MSPTFSIPNQPKILDSINNLLGQLIIQVSNIKADVVTVFEHRGRSSSTGDSQGTTSTEKKEIDNYPTLREESQQDKGKEGNTKN